MCDVKKYEKIYEEIKCLEPEDTLQLTLEADSEEQREFYQMVGYIMLQFVMYLLCRMVIVSKYKTIIIW